MKKDRIELDHGSGSEASGELIKEIFLSRLDNQYLRSLDNSAVVNLDNGRFAITTDSYVVHPVFFPGGNIGSLTVHGTINDLSMQGAKPLYITLGLIIEEGFSFEDLIKITDSISHASKEAEVVVVAGDTKMVPKARADGIFINTSGIGIIPDGIDVSSFNARPGDVILINGTVGDHSKAILSKREGLDFDTPILSDSSPFNFLVSEILSVTDKVHVLRDPIRGGLATALNEIVRSSSVGIRIFEDSVPVNGAVMSACEILGIDPYYVANEGKCIVVVAPDDADKVLDTMKRHPHGKGSCIIGEVIDEEPGRVLVKTTIGGTRILSMLTGEQLPRIC